VAQLHERYMMMMMAVIELA